MSIAGLMSPDPEVLDDLYGAEEFARDMGVRGTQLDELRTFRDMLETWNNHMNLVGPSALPTFWKRHALDSAQLLHVEQSALVWADVGAGAGFPGIVLAIMLKGRQGAQVHLIESIGKRIGFLESVASALKLPVVLHHARAETIKLPERLQIVTARACAPLPRLFGYTRHLLQPGVQGLFLKGRDVRSELTEAERGWTFDVDLTPSLSDPAGWVVRIERLVPRGR